MHQYFMDLKNRIPVVFGLLVMAVKTNAQPASLERELLTRLDSVSTGSSVARYFAAIYLATTQNAVNFFAHRDKQEKDLMVRLEARFAGYFFRSANAYQARSPIPPEWKAYYEDSAASELRYILYGINAHINGDIWQALTSEFSLAEIRELKPGYYSYYRGLTQIYGEVYAFSLSNSSKIRWLHTLTLGLSKPLGRILLAKWRRRQMNLAVLYYTNRPLFDKKIKKLEKKKKHLDNLIRKNI